MKRGPVTSDGGADADLNTGVSLVPFTGGTSGLSEAVPLEGLGVGTGR